MKKIGLTLTLALFFILGFIFKYFFDFKLLEKLAENNNNSKTQVYQIFHPEDTVSQIGTQIQSPQNIIESSHRPIKPLVNINDLIYAQAQERDTPDSIVNEGTYATPNQNPNFFPIRDWSVLFAEISAKSAIVTDQSTAKIFYQKNIYEKLPIASLTKLMTAVIAFENKDLNESVKISKAAMSQEGEAGGLTTGEEITLKNLLKAMLIESSNDAAYAIKEHLASSGIDIIDLMNKKAESLEMKDTHYISSSGLDDEDNYSTARDLTKLISYTLNNQELWDILGTASTDIMSTDKLRKHHLINSNQLLGKVPGLLGGKTGFTDQAKGCLLTVTKINADIKIISVIIGSDDRFGEMEKLINWIKKAYRFN